MVGVACGSMWAGVDQSNITLPRKGYWVDICGTSDCPTRGSDGNFAQKGGKLEANEGGKQGLE